MAIHALAMAMGPSGARRRVLLTLRVRIGRDGGSSRGRYHSEGAVEA